MVALGVGGGVNSTRIIKGNMCAREAAVLHAFVNLFITTREQWPRCAMAASVKPGCAPRWLSLPPRP